MINDDRLNMDEYEYVDVIMENLDSIEDQKLRNLVARLVDERNNLINDLKLDALTGAYNRRILDNIRNFTSVVICDIDDFKQINDSFGHQTGDSILKFVSKTLANNSRINDYVCRYGGDEFLVVFCEASEEIVKKRMADVSKSLMEASSLAGCKISLSIGISGYKMGATLESIIGEADKALYVSKQAGKNRITCYDELQSEEVLSSVNIEKLGRTK